MVAHYSHTVGIGRYEYGARFQLPATSSDERALIRRSARARLPPPGPPPWARLTVGRESLELAIVVRIHVPGPCGVARLVLGMLLQSIAARFDSEAPYYDPADPW